jgi:hypothetical protein
MCNYLLQLLTFKPRVCVNILTNVLFYQSQMTCDEASGKKKKSKFHVVVWNVITKHKRIPASTETFFVW